ncbi:hypothetical protein EMIHUDRAFT_211915 [Emiliania huxleyi CCMP1516]|uniref:Uncharacterized protein n=2 Tax=Emiliania huxleyi TaxID=2903 RepID=A0A0D3IT63_EMIH1|nr:hypothetical protein EMIHUDRAFT_211915 [Emiliania huxleyi CCMP1516]EOD14448.1 hypothetical protein EMIHUDRAFT_211915 [Emiliania huxleyi CCMP1516]|eukprot:XP_005766877.1 hypothetical protein EMIHUDRAFT_211915 [Emiliania huxleyi CCMP1516]
MSRRVRREAELLAAQRTQQEESEKTRNDVVSAIKLAEKLGARAGEQEGKIAAQAAELEALRREKVEQERLIRSLSQPAPKPTSPRRPEAFPPTPPSGTPPKPPPHAAATPSSEKRGTVSSKVLRSVSRLFQGAGSTPRGSAERRAAVGNTGPPRETKASARRAATASQLPNGTAPSVSRLPQPPKRTTQPSKPFVAPPKLGGGLPANGRLSCALQGDRSRLPRPSLGGSVRCGEVATAGSMAAPPPRLPCPAGNENTPPSRAEQHV